MAVAPPSAALAANGSPPSARAASASGCSVGSTPTSTSHAPLHRRILYPSKTGPQPPRILHSASHTTLDPLLLDLVALICREYVLNWYSRISPDRDRSFIQQVSSILVHVIQALEVRLAHVDLVELVVLDLPAVVEQHVSDWDQASQKAKTGHAHNYDTHHVFHLLQPHIAISLVESPSGPGQLEPSVDKVYQRALVDNLLRLLLPPEDYRAETERTIVREIIVNIIFGSVYTKVAQPWFLHQTIGKMLEAREQRKAPEVAKRTREASAAPKQPAPEPVTAGKIVDKVFNTLASIPRLLSAVGASLSALYHTATAAPVPSHYSHQPPLTTPLLNLITTLLPPSPAISQTVHYLQIPIHLFPRFVTSLVFYLVNDKLLNAGLVKALVDATTRGLFPDGHPPPKVPDPTTEEQVELRRRCEEALARALPDKLATTLLPPEIEGRKVALARHLLRPLESHVANVHLFVLVVDLVVGRLFPELVVGTDD